MRRTSSKTDAASTSASDDCQPVKKERSCLPKTATTKEILADLAKKRYLIGDEHFMFEYWCLDRIDMTSTSNPKHLKKIALTLYYMSSEGYEYVRKTYKTVLPPPQDLGKLWMNDSFRPGLTKTAFDILKQKSAGKRLVCALVVDDISLFGNSKRLDGGYRIGIEDFGVGLLGDYEEFARSAYVFTLVSLQENWKIPIAYVMLKETNYKRRAHLIMTCLRESYCHGVDVVALNFDLLNSFSAVARHLGCDFQNPRELKTTFKHPECDIHISVFFNTWWLKVMIRNTLNANILFKEDKKVNWQQIKNLRALQERSVDYKKKLTKHHLHFKNQLLKLDLTNLTFSHSVAEALESYSEMIEGSDKEEAKATTEYVVMFNNLCDVLASSAHARSGFKRPLCKENSKEIFDFLEEARRYILSLKFKTTPIVDTNKNQSYVTFLVCIESLKHMYKSVVERDQKLDSIATERFSSDNTWALVDNLLRKGNKEPRAAEFHRLYQILGTDLRATPVSASCIIAENLPMAKFAAAVTNINYTSGRLAYNETYTNMCEEAEALRKHKKDKSLDTIKIYVKILNKDTVTDSDNEIVGSISGWVVKELLKVVKCESCLDALLTNEEYWFHKLIPIRLNTCSFCLPSEDVFRVCLKAETLTKKFKREVGHLMNNPVSIESLKVATLQRFVDSDILSSLKSHSKEQPPMYNHRMQLMRAIIDKYVDVRTDNIKTNKPKKRAPMW